MNARCFVKLGTDLDPDRARHLTADFENRIGEAARGVPQDAPTALYVVLIDPEGELAGDIEDCLRLEIRARTPRQAAHICAAIEGSSINLADPDLFSNALARIREVSKIEPEDI